MWGGAGFLSVVSILAILVFSNYTGRKLYQYYFINDSYKLLAVALGVSLFMLFKNMKVPQSNLINRIAQSCFGVLLIHANGDTMRQWLWTDILDVPRSYYTDSFILHSVISVIGIYAVCTIIDQLRIMWIENPFFKWIGNKYPSWNKGIWMQGNTNIVSAN